MSSLRPTLLAVCVLSLAAEAGRLAAADDGATSFTANAPVTNPTVSTFTKEGYRSWLLRGTKCRYVSQNQIDFTDLNLTVFSSDAANRVDSIFLSPAAVALIDQARVSGPGSVRFITDDLEATGEDWTYDHRQKKVSIRKNVRVVFHAPLQGILR